MKIRMKKQDVVKSTRSKYPLGFQTNFLKLTLDTQLRLGCVQSGLIEPQIEGYLLFMVLDI